MLIPPWLMHRRTQRLLLTFSFCHNWERSWFSLISAPRRRAISNLTFSLYREQKHAHLAIPQPELIIIRLNRILLLK